jgi:glycerol-1-phosphate dehydrogenase [NAD(P)+]
MAEEAIGEPFALEEHDAVEVIAGLGAVTLCANDPPWGSLAGRLPAPVRLVVAGDMEQETLDLLVAGEPDGSETVVGLGGGTALDTAKYLAWRTGKRLVQVPTITSVDAGFTDAVGVRVGGRVRYVGHVVPQLVVLDVPLVQSAPARLNRAGIGDVLSCHTALFDWRLAADAGEGHPWRDDLAALGRTLLTELDEAAGEVGAVSADGVRYLASTYRRIGAACAAAGHSRFEEGSEHFWAYALEHATGAHHVHGELVALGVTLLSHVQGNDPAWVAGLIDRAGTRANPHDLGIAEHDAVGALLGLGGYARAEGLDVSVADLRPADPAAATAAWRFAEQLPRR